MEEEIRKKAIEKYIKGQPPKTIYTEFKRSKKWFFKWLRRYQTGHKHWYKDHPGLLKNDPQNYLKLKDNA